MQKTKFCFAFCIMEIVTWGFEKVILQTAATFLKPHACYCTIKDSCLMKLPLTTWSVYTPLAVLAGKCNVWL